MNVIFYNRNDYVKSTDVFFSQCIPGRFLARVKNRQRFFNVFFFSITPPPVVSRFCDN